MLDFLSKKTKSDLIKQIVDLLEERNKLCARIDELTLPQFQEVQEKAEQDKFIKDERKHFIHSNAILRDALTDMANLACVGRDYIDDETYACSLFAGIDAIFHKTLSRLDGDDDE